MAPRRFVPLAAVVALTFAGPATAKELTRATICGQGGACSVIRDRERLELVPTGGATSAPAPPRQPYFVLTFTIEHGGETEELGVLYLPESSLLAANGVAPGEMVWLPIGDPRSAALLRDAVAGIEPHPETPVWPWPHGLKSTYRVVPGDALPPTPRPSRQPAPGGRDDRSALAPVVAIALALLALAFTPRSAVVPSVRRPARPGSRPRERGRRPR